MLSGILSSDRAIKVNIQIMRVFTKLRGILATHKDIKRKIEDIIRIFGSKLQEHDQKFKIVFETINQLLEPPTKEQKKQYGFIVGSQ